jgi:pilus assembly protein CpaF
VTVAARARIERGVVERLREAPDGRPRREHLSAALRDTLVDQRLVIPAGELRLLERWLDDRLFGLGELAPLLRDDRVTEVMVNGTRGVWVERDGRLEEAAIHFADPEEILVLIERLVAPLGRRIDLASPLVDARLADGSRVHAVIPPISLVGPVLTIRRFAQRALGPDDLVRNGTLPPDVMAYLVRAVRDRRSILVSGGTSSGKTTTLNALAFAVGDRERIVTIEDAAELRLDQRHVLRLEARPKNIEGEGEVAIRELVRNSLRMRPDRIIVGEVRGSEALDMLQAMNTGHDGSLCTVHANTCRDALSRIETMVLMAGFDLPVRAIRQQVASALDLIVHLERLEDGSRKVTTITEVQRMESEVITLQDIFEFKVDQVTSDRVVIGSLRATGLRPAFLHKFEKRGVSLPNSLFMGGRGSMPEPLAQTASQ